ncbi:MAG TPA: DUF2865 domain-containing protein [Hyphomicrobiaceae bacterium]|nr:DUF2865 domain-containing protein [Hyphomicrobiaceae bacterium]
MAACSLASLPTLGLATDRPVPHVQLAASGDDPFLSFLNGLLGLEPPSGEPQRRWRPLQDRRQRSPPRRPAPTLRPQPATVRPAETLPEPEPAEPRPATYRTMCVRLCDGYYWPISFATRKDGLARDALKCERSCDGTAALYYYPNPGGAPKDMISLQGIPYKSLGTAFLYRSIYDARCKCRPHPWERGRRAD